MQLDLFRLDGPRLNVIAYLDFCCGFYSFVIEVKVIRVYLDEGISFLLIFM